MEKHSSLNLEEVYVYIERIHLGPNENEALSIFVTSRIRSRFTSFEVIDPEHLGIYGSLTKSPVRKYNLSLMQTRLQDGKWKAVGGPEFRFEGNKIALRLQLRSRVPNWLGDSGYRRIMSQVTETAERMLDEAEKTESKFS